PRAFLPATEAPGSGRREEFIKGVLVMAGLAPAIHGFLAKNIKDVDARHKAGHDDSKLEIHLERVEPAGMAVDGVNNLPLIDEHVIELHRAGGRAFLRQRREGGDFFWL